MLDLPPSMDALLDECASFVGRGTMVAIVKVESGGNPYAINVNGRAQLKAQPRSKADAVRIAADLIKKGYNIDMGLAQINSKNLAWLGLSPTSVFDPCLNLNAGAKVLQHSYARAKKVHKDDQRALLSALSAYNTGHLERGFGNGYVQKVTKAAGSSVTIRYEPITETAPTMSKFAEALMRPSVTYPPL